MTCCSASLFKVLMVWLAGLMATLPNYLVRTLHYSCATKVHPINIVQLLMRTVTLQAELPILNFLMPGSSLNNVIIMSYIMQVSINECPLHNRYSRQKRRSWLSRVTGRNQIHVQLIFSGTCTDPANFSHPTWRCTLVFKLISTSSRTVGWRCQLDTTSLMSRLITA